MPDPIAIGLLPLYLKLYDDRVPEARPEADAFAATVAGALRDRGAAVVSAPVCRVEAEVRAALADFAARGVDAVVTLHLAYSPSLEAADALAESPLPLVVLDTTPDERFDAAAMAAGRLMYNHGIHGVQDLCNLLLRRGKKFALAVGHWSGSDVLDRTLALAAGCRAATAFRNQKVALVGEPFAGMGDFQVPFEVLERRFGITVKTVSSEAAAQAAYDRDRAAQLEREWRRSYPDAPAELAASLAASLATLACVRQAGAEAFSVNFLAVTGAPGLAAMPFLASGLGMAEGLGYAGEGDVLTAALCRAVLAADPESTFSEMFCPDWQGDRVLLSHMGEVNPELLSPATRSLRLRQFPYTPAADPVYFSGELAAGTATLINLAPGPEDSFTLIAAAGRLATETAVPGDDVTGWFAPASGDLAGLLRDYSLAGGTHHLVLSRNLTVPALENMARELGIAFRAV